MGDIDNPNPRGWRSPEGRLFLDLERVEAVSRVGSDEISCLIRVYIVNREGSLDFQCTRTVYELLVDALEIYKSGR